MGFSTTPEAAASEMGIMLNIAEKLGVLLDKGKLQETIKFANGLTASEKADAEDARANIAEYRNLIADQTKRKNALDAFEAALNDDKAKMDAAYEAAEAKYVKKDADILSAQAAIAAANKQLDLRQSALDEHEENIAQREKDIAISNQSIAVEIERLRKKEMEIDAKRSDVEAYEAAVKAKAAQFQKLAGEM